MNKFQKGWFSENDDAWKGLVQSYQVNEVLAHEKSNYQDILIFNGRKTGITMAIDDIIQSTEMDEFSYHEMMAHVALYSHPNPKNVLIIGGGDCGVAREVLKHKCIESVELCDIDPKVTELSKKYLPHLTKSACKDQRLHIYHIDGIDFVEKHQNSYDVIITDSCDPVGPATKLFGISYYQNVLRALKKGGISVSQGENFWVQQDVVLEMRNICREVGFKYIEYSNINIPTYPTGSIGALIVNNESSCHIPKREMSKEEAESMKYYNRNVHIASFALPEMFRRLFESK
ncbi:hypothetical protein M9Y10_012696 [Tritrichomonas musculus]|uniref:PABS domain-containing protein n=1 Tax=Tritrichomonas musculus TaxID=1915356 RepID=A0ABR2IE63_9EUKA